MSFVHLHTHSEYSLLDGASRISDMVRLAVETGMPAIALTSCLGGDVANRLLERDEAGAEQAAVEYQRMFGDDYFLEIQNHGMEEQLRVNEGLVRISRRTGIPLVATNDSHYTRRDDAEAHDILLCLQTGTVVSETNRMRFQNDEFYLKTPAEMAERFRDYPEAVANTVRIAQRCHLQLETRPLLPRFEVPTGQTAEGYLRQLAERGLKDRYPELTATVRDRFEMEIGVIEDMGYAPYFLIVSDFIDYARSHGVAVGPGRGSAAGSIVSYALGITTLDPLKHGLIFEGLLSRERISMPDIDIDFDDRNRDRVIEYVGQRYGEDHVAQIITFGTMKARAVIRDVGRALDVPLRDVDR